MATLSTCCWSPKPLWSPKLVTRVGSCVWSWWMALRNFVLVEARLQLLLWLFLLLMNAPLPKELHQFLIWPGAKRKYYLMEFATGVLRAPPAHAASPSPPSMFCKLELFGSSGAGMRTSHSTLFQVMYLSLLVSDSCPDTMELLIVIFLKFAGCFFWL